MRDHDGQAQDQHDHHDLRPQPSARRFRDDGGMPDRCETPRTERAEDDEGGERERRIDELGGEELDPALGLQRDRDDQDDPTGIAKTTAARLRRTSSFGRGPGTRTRGARRPPATLGSGRRWGSRVSDRSKRRHDSTRPSIDRPTALPVTGRLGLIGGPRRTPCRTIANKAGR